MNVFRLYRLGSDGKISGPSEVIDVEAVADAIDRAAGMTGDGERTELWYGAKQVWLSPAAAGAPLAPASLVRRDLTGPAK